jgi:hypothetical protein
MRPAVFAGLLLTLCSPVLAGPRVAAHHHVLGVVAETDRGHLDSQDAKVGSDIYSCDSLDTNKGGDLRVRMTSSQMYLSAMSSAQLEDDGMNVSVLAEAGTVGFSEPTTGNISVRTPAGTVRAEGGMAVAGEVTYKSATELVITAIRGNLTLDNGGDLREIPQGKSADVTFDDPLSQGCHDGGFYDPPGLSAPAKIGFFLVPAAAIGIPIAVLWPGGGYESESKPHQ